MNLKMVVFVFFAFMSCLSAQNCICPETNIKEIYTKSSLIFEGETLKSPGYDGMKKDEYLFRIIKVWKGKVKGENVSIFSDYGGEDCKYGFMDGKKYLVFAFGENVFHTGFCNRNMDLELAEFEIEFMKRLPQSLHNASLLGKILFCEKVTENKYTLPPIKDIEVNLAGNNLKYIAKSDSNGFYYFEDILPGNYILTINNCPAYGIAEFIDDNGNISCEDSIKVEVAPNNFSVNRIILSYNNEINGTVYSSELDRSTGNYIELAPTRYFAQNIDSANFSDVYFNIPVLLICLTDSKGEFRFNNIPPGDYYLFRIDFPYGPNGVPGKTFYPGTEDINKAEVLTFEKNTIFNDMDIFLVGHEYFSITGRVVLPDGKLCDDVTLSLSKDSVVTSFVGIFAESKTKEGVFNFTVVENTDCWLHIGNTYEKNIQIGKLIYEKPKPIRINANQNHTSIKIVLKPNK